MSEIMKCPFCWGDAHIQGHGYSTAEYRVYCETCGCSTKMWSESKDKAIAAWNRRAQPKNEPLTLEELRKMRGQMVDVPESKFWVGGSGSIADDGVYDPEDENGYWPFEYYGEWFAYRQKPERSEWND